MANKKGEGVRGVLGDLVSREKERKERSSEPLPSTVSNPAGLEEHPEQPDSPHDEAMPPRKIGGIKGRPRAKKDETSAPKGERTKVTLSIDETLREEFYRLAWKEGIQPGEWMERAARYYIETHPK